MTDYLVTGSSGFIGGRIVELLRETGRTVVGLDNRPKASHTQLVVDIAGWDGGFFHAGGCAPAAVLHLAALGGVRRSLEDPLPYPRSNVLGSSHVLEACRLAEVPKLVLVSSSSVYGDSERMPLSEDMPCIGPLSTYAAGKRSMELTGWMYSQTYGMDVTVVRPFSVYGPNCRKELVVRKFLEAVLTGRSVEVYGDGTAARDFTYVDDVARGILKASERKGWGLYNLGGGRSVSVNGLVGLINAVSGRKLDVTYTSERAGEVKKTSADIGRAACDLDWRPEVGIEEGLERTWRWLKDA